MQNVASDLLLLTTNLSQLKNRDRIIELFIESICTIFPDYSFKWFSDSVLESDLCLPVCTRNNTYGYLLFEKDFSYDKEMYALFYNSTQLLAIILERLEQDDWLSNQKIHLQHLVDEKTNHLVEKQEELNELNEEFSAINEELIETNKWLSALNEQLQSEITERKNAEEELRQSEEKFKNVFEHASVGKSITSIDGSLKVNKAFCEILGYSSDELSSKKWQDITHPEDIELNQKMLQSILAGERANAEWQKRYIHKNGNIVWVTISTSLQRDEKGNPLFYITTINDITDQKLMQEELLQSEQLFSSIFYNSPVAIIMTSRGDGRIIDANNTFLNNLEFTRDEVVGKSIGELGIFNDPDAREKLVETLLKNGFVSDFECSFRSKTGKVTTGLMSMSFIMYKGMPHQLTTVIDITDRKKSEQVLLQTKNNFQVTIDESPMGMRIISTKGVTIYVNQSLLDIFGFVSINELNETPASIKYTPESYQDHLIRKEKRKRGEETIPEYEISIIQKSGDVRHLHVNRKKVLWDGKMQSMVIYQDATESKLAEIKLRDSERLLNESQKVSGIGSYTQNLVTGIWTGSFYLNKMFGIDTNSTHSVEEWLEVIHPDDRTMMDDYFTNEVVGEKSRFNKEYRILPKNSNSEKWVHGIGELEFDSNGNPIKMVGTIQDITERKQTEESTRIANEMLQKVLDSIPQFICWKDRNSVFLGCNNNYAKMVGLSNPESIIGKTDWDLPWKKEETENFLKYDRKIMDSDTAEYNIIEPAYDANGNETCLNTNKVPLHDADGKVSGILVAFQDITERKLMEDELRLAKEHAEESDRLKSSFLANMSHEIRTPMNSIMGFASLLPEEESKELMCQYASIIVQNSEQLVSLIDSIVMYSKLQSGLFAFKPVQFEVHRLLNDIQHSFNLPIYQQGITLINKNNISEKAQIYSDYDKLRQIITNLTVNAFKYTHNGLITLGCDQKDDYFEFYVKDSGIGIPQKDLPHIFERFYRGSNVDEISTRGTGLGLCIVKELVEMLGGKIWVESEVGKGSTFYFTIPDDSK